MPLQLDPHVGVRTQYDPIQVGLANWRSVWALRQIFQDGQQTGASKTASPTLHGFWINCAEFWLLSQKILKQVTRTKTLSNVQDTGKDGVLWWTSQNNDETNMSRLHAFLCLQDGQNIG